MDSHKLILLKVDLQVQMNLMAVIHQKLLDRATRLSADDDIILESIAYQIHNLYCTVEDLLKIVASCFENNMSSTSQWHSILLQRMTMEIPGIRPALLSPDSYTILNSMRGFRHFFRHAYASDIDYQQLTMNLHRALELKKHLDHDVSQFLLRLDSEKL